jgi:SAM-dependent methyltransferase
MYDLLAEHYEDILPTSKAQVDFVLGYCTKAGSVGGKAAGDEAEGARNPRLLDVGCGTGALAAAVSGGGVDVDAVDLNGEMIRRARELHGDSQPLRQAGFDPVANEFPKTLPPDGPEKTRAGRLRFHEADMRRLERIFSPDNFDVISCLGNTLVHLKGPEEIGAFLSQSAGLLRSGGSLILQILNYDYLLASRREDLPPVRTQRIEFLRRYRYPETGRHVVFATSIRDLETGEIRDDEVELYPLKKAELSQLLEKAGFGAPRLFGGFDGSPCAGDSLPLIAVAES